MSRRLLDVLNRSAEGVGIVNTTGAHRFGKSFPQDRERCVCEMSHPAEHERAPLVKFPCARVIALIQEHNDVAHIVSGPRSDREQHTGTAVRDPCVLVLEALDEERGALGEALSNFSNACTELLRRSCSDLWIRTLEVADKVPHPLRIEHPTLLS